MSRRIPVPKAVPYSKVPFSYQVNSWLIRWSYRALRAGLPLTEEALSEFCWAKVSRYTESDYDVAMGGGVTKHLWARLTETQALATIAGAVRYVLATYDVAEFSKIQAARARKSRRFHVSDLAKHAHLSIKQAAAAMGCSTATVSRLRKALKASALGRLTVLLRQAKPVESFVPWGIDGLLGLQMSPGCTIFDFGTDDLIPWRTP